MRFCVLHESCPKVKKELVHEGPYYSWGDGDEKCREALEGILEGIPKAARKSTMAVAAAAT